MPEERVLPKRIEDLAYKIHEVLLGENFEDIIRVTSGCMCVACKELGLSKAGALHLLNKMWDNGFGEGEDGNIPEG